MRRAVTWVSIVVLAGIIVAFYALLLSWAQS